MSGSTIDDNSLIALEEADEYFDILIEAPQWAAVGNNSKQRALNSATARIMSIPHINVDDLADDEAKLDIFKCAIAQEALSLATMGQSVHLTNQALGIESVSLGGDSVKYTKKSSLQSLAAQDLLKPYIRGAFKVV